MAELEKTIKALKDWKNDPLAMNAEIDPCLVDDAMSVIEQMEQEIERLKAEKAPATRHEWLDKEYGFGTCVATCSNCGRYVKGTAHDNGFGFDYFFYPFCPYCGVEMNEEDVDDGDEEDEEGDPDA